MDAKTHFLIPSIHIKKEKISDDEAESMHEPGEFLRYFNKGAGLLLDDVEVAARDLGSGRETKLLPDPVPKPAYADVNQNWDVPKSRNGAQLGDILAETIDCVARGLFESKNDRERSPKIKPKKSVIHRKMPPQRLYRRALENSKELALLLSKPLELNWKREVVHRSSGNALRHMADAYYFSPSGRKFRSLPEVAGYLEDINERTLSISSFTFHKARVSTHPNETERYAKRRTDLRGTPQSSKKIVREPKPKNKWASPGDSNSSSALQKTDSDDVDESQKSVSFWSLVSETKEKSEDEASNREINEEAKEEETADVNRENNGEDCLMQKCSTSCPGQEGIIPTLHCSSCLCLFHPECIGLVKSNFEILQFTCKECRNKEGAHANPVTCVLQTNQTDGHSSSAGQSRASSASAHTSWTISNLQSSTTSLSQKLFLIKTSNQKANGPVVEKQVQLPLTQAANSDGTKHFPGGLTIERVANAATRLGPTEPDAASISLIRVTQPRPAAAPQKPLTVLSNALLKPNVQIILPAPLAQGTIVPYSVIRPKSYVAPAPLQPGPPMQNTNHTLVAIVNPSPHVTQVVLPRNGTPSHATTAWSRMASSHAQVLHTYSRVSRSPTSPLAPISPNGVNSRCPASGNRPSHDHAYNKHTTISSADASSTSSIKPTNADVCWISVLHRRHEDLLRIFRYFTMADLMRTTLVCQAWRSAVKLPAMWRHVVLRNMRITCWETCARIIRERGTRHLDMRGMCLHDDKNRTWHEFAAILNQLKGISRLDIGEVPAAIVHTVANTLTQLEGLSAEWIVDSTKDAHNVTGNCRLFIGKLCQLPHLTFLRIRGVYGLHLPSPSFGLDCLECLKHLKHLSLTSFKYQTAPDLNFLKSFACLSVLELGDCHEWTIESYESIGHLTQLKSLRLEFEGKACCEGLMPALHGLKNLIRLDLIVFQIPPNLGEILAALTKLKVLSIWPDSSSQAAENNYNTLQGLKTVPFVRSFTWGLITSDLAGNRTGDKFDHQANNVPFLTASDDGQLVEVKINAGVLMGRLRSALPSSKVQVMMVPNSSYSTIGCMPR